MAEEQAQHTPGPWAWGTFGPHLVLATPKNGRLIVMDFVRNGMSGASPRFSDRNGEKVGGLMSKVTDVAAAEAHPDARLIAAAPDLLEACKAAREELVRREIALDIINDIDAAIAKATPK